MKRLLRFFIIVFLIRLLLNYYYTYEHISHLYHFNSLFEFMNRIFLIIIGNLLFSWINFFEENYYSLYVLRCFVLLLIYDICKYNKNSIKKLNDLQILLLYVIFAFEISGLLLTILIQILLSRPIVGIS